MIQAQVFGVNHCSNQAILLEAANVEELILKLCKEFDRVDPDSLRSCAVLINNENVMNQDRGKTKLKDGDEVLFLTPMIGG
ncbi:hypothetical protein JCM17380_39520 [Desulfosporosinus burensis]